MRLAEISEETQKSDDAFNLEDAESRFDDGCSKLDSGEWDEAYKIFKKLGDLTLPSDLVHVARMATNILAPENSTETKARRILQLLATSGITSDFQNGGQPDS